jgi:acetyl esterase/lipase
MCARRFLILVFFLILLFVAGAFAIFQFGQKVLIRQATPQGHFQAPATSSLPDYSKAETWISRPDIPGNPSRWLPPGADPAESTSAAVFYIHPTTYLERDRWNAPLSGNSGDDDRDSLFVQSQASAFSGAGTIWAPRYRQAAYGAFLLRSEDAEKALDLAFSDVSAAFDEFLKRNPEGPIILAGHSQGALHLSRLLQKHASQLNGRLVAAYVVGWPLSVTADLAPAGLNACNDPEQTGCVLSWQSFGSPANPDLIMDAWEGTRGPSGMKRERKDMLCVNPLTGTKDGRASPQANAGTLVPAPDLKSARLEAGRVGAHCDNGLLILDGDIPALGPFVLPGNNYHVYDYALFWTAIRRDSVRRLRAWHR